MDQQTTVMQNETPLPQQQQLTQVTEVESTLHHKQDITPAESSIADEVGNMNIDTMFGVESGMQSNPDSQNVQRKRMSLPLQLRNPRHIR
jgi:hypothetical protein